MKRGLQTPDIPRLDFKSLDWINFYEHYSQFQALIIEGCATPESHDAWDVSELSKLYATERGKAAVDHHFCFEQADPGRRSKLSAEAVFGKSRPPGNWYATFILQHDQKVLDGILRGLPFPELQPAHAKGTADCAAVQVVDRSGELSTRP